MPDTADVSIQGTKFSYHDIARSRYFDNANQTTLERDAFAEVFEDVQSGRSRYGLVAIENSLYGSINEVYDLLIKDKVWISGEIYLRINHCLLGVKGSQLEDIKEVYSHPIALAQCHNFLETKLAHATRFEYADTAASAATVAKWNDPTKAAVAGRQAAEEYGLEILAEGIETDKQNYTRFIIIQKDEPKIENANKTSIVMRTDHKPGALYRALGVFAENGINLSKLESRPIIGKAWHYIFYVDFDEGAETANSQRALKELDAMDAQVTILGSYKKGEIIQ